MNNGHNSNKNEEPKFNVNTRVSGLVNVGNSCYMNSIIQALCGTDVFASYLISHRFNDDIKPSILKKMYSAEKEEYRKNHNGSAEDFEFQIYPADLVKQKKNTLTYWLYKLVNRMWSENCKVRLNKFRELAQKRIVAVRGFNQEDASEFLTFLIDEIERDLRVRCTITDIKIHTPESSQLSKEYTDIETSINKEKNSQTKKQREKELLLRKNEQYNSYALHEYIKTWNEYLNKYGGNYSIIVDTFMFAVISEIECLTCHIKSIKIDTENMMKVTVPQSDKPVELQDLISKDHNLIETLDDDNKYNCSICDSKQKALKRMHTWNMPERLIIQLKLFEIREVNFQYQYNKIYTKVNFPAILDLNEYKSEYNPLDLNYKYELYAVVHHSGNHRGGHYVSYVKNPLNNQWFLFNDQVIMPATEKTVLSDDPYMLFYKRINTFDSEFDSSDESAESNSDTDDDIPIVNDNVDPMDKSNYVAPAELVKIEIIQ